MKSPRQWLQALGVGVVISGALASAQLPESTTSREVVSATGCVQQVSSDEATAGGQHVGSAFVLTGVRVGPIAGLAERPALPATSPGTPASTEGSQANNTAEPGSGASSVEARASGNDIASSRPRDGGLLLIADRGVDLASHIGHRVMVSGRLSSFAAAGGVASTASGRALTVTKVSPIAPGCTAGS